MNKVPVILGQTAVGKTALALSLAPRLNAEIISADSMQVYRGLDIGTAKPSTAERQAVTHHLIDIKNPDEAWTVSDFVEQAVKAVEEIEQRTRTPLIVGGTGLYLWTLLNGYSFPIAPADKELRQRLEKEPLTDLYSRLTEIDPASAKKIHAHDKKRIIRALEVYELTGKPISQLQKKGQEPRRSVAGNPYILIGLTMPRQELYERIELRVDQMIEKGLIEEVKALLSKGYSKNLPSLQALGYKEAIEYLDGKWSREQMIRELKKRTRNFARRQMTWFKRFKGIKWFPAPACLPDRQVDSQAVLDYINSI